MNEFKFDKWVVALFVATLIVCTVCIVNEPAKFLQYFAFIAFSFITMITNGYKNAKHK